MVNTVLQDRLSGLRDILARLTESPYSIEIYISLSRSYAELGYPDLAAGAVYKGLLLIDAILDEDEYAEEAAAAVSDCIQSQTYDVRSEVLKDHPDLRTSLRQANSRDEASLSEPTEEEVLIWVRERYAPQVYVLLAQYLYICGCWQSSYKYCDIGLGYSPGNESLLYLKEVVRKTVVESQHAGSGSSSSAEDDLNIEDWPDSGFVRRECYPWNDIEPDRCSDESLAELNTEMSKVAPKFEVRATDLPNLTSSGDKSKPIKQLGVFAKEDIAPGEVVLKETSLLTANNRLQDALCDACSVDLPELSTGAASSQASTVVSCEECLAVFCSQDCHDQAMELYHPALCDKDVDSLARGRKPAEAADSLYLLLLLRSLALAETQEIHPLSLKEVKYIWGDYSNAHLQSTWTAPPPLSTLTSAPSANMDKAFSSMLRILPFSFSYNIVLPFHMLTKMDINIFTSFETYDVWIFNTLFAKFRGTASARLSGLGGQRVRGPEVSAVHPNWCLVNHSCDPHLRWEWGGEVTFTVREERQEWKREGETKDRAQAGIKKGEEVLNHYCDVDLAVQQRREWAAGSLGGPYAPGYSDLLVRSKRNMLSRQLPSQYASSASVWILEAMDQKQNVQHPGFAAGHPRNY